MLSRCATWTRACLARCRAIISGRFYGTRVASNTCASFPDRVRTAVLDGVAPPDMRPAAVSRSMARLRSTHDRRLRERHRLRSAFSGVCDAGRALFRLHFASRSRSTLTDPLTGRSERMPFTRESMVAALRTPHMHRSSRCAAVRGRIGGKP